MPFPLAHPAAVLPLRHYCPRHLSFPALIIGSLTPDIGYCFGHFHLDKFSHRFLAGSFGFCLPAGLLILLVLFVGRSAVVKILPSRYRQLFLPLCQRPVGSPVVLVVSLLIGAWTHIVLDSVTHQDGWLVKHMPFLQSSIPWAGIQSFEVCDVLYAACTFFGVVWLAIYYLRWLEESAGSLFANTQGMKRASALLLAVSILFIATASRGEHPAIGMVPAAMLAILTLIAFLVVTARAVSRTRVQT